MNESRNFADRLRKWRVKRELTQGEAAELLGVGRSYISELENGREPGRLLVDKLDILERDPTVGRVHSSTPRDALQRERLAADLSFPELAKLTGYSVGVLQAVENGYGRASEKMIEALCRVLPGLSKEELMAGSDHPLVVQEGAGIATYGKKPDVVFPKGMTGRYVPLISWAQAGHMHAGWTDEAYDYQGVLAVNIKDPKAFAVGVRGDSMQPRIAEGDTAIITPSSEPRAGEIVLARTLEGDVMLKLYQPRDGGKLVVLSSYNQAYPPVEYSRADLAWIYPVDQVVQNLRKL